MTTSLSSAGGAKALEQLDAQGVSKSQKERESMSSSGSYSTVTSFLSTAFNSAGGPLSNNNMHLMQHSNAAASLASQQVGNIMCIDIAICRYSISTHRCISYSARKGSCPSFLTIPSSFFRYSSSISYSPSYFLYPILGTSVCSSSY